MAQGDGAIYNNFKEEVMEGVFNLAAGGNGIQVILVGTYTPDIDTHIDYGDVSGTEYNAGAGYTPFGETLAGQDVTQDDANDRGVFDATDLTWTSLGPLTPAHPTHAIMLLSGTAANDKLIAYWETSGTAPNGANWTLEWGTNGIILLT
jgi:hypothetical protein